MLISYYLKMSKSEGLRVARGKGTSRTAPIINAQEIRMDNVPTNPEAVIQEMIRNQNLATALRKDGRLKR